VRVRRRVVVTTFGLALGSWLWAASVAWGVYNVTPSCTSAGQTATCGRGWYTSPVQVYWTWSPTDGSAASGTCATQSFWQDATTEASCIVTGPEGSGGGSQAINVETSTPTVSGVPTRPPDHNGWYNHPVAVAFHGTAFSGIASCATTTYAGPDAPSASVSGSCTDNAGKTASTASPPFAYDAMPPPPHISADAGDRIVVLHWASADIASPVAYQIVRRPGLRQRASSVVYRGRGSSFADARVRNGVRYRYTIRARDQAANVTVRSLVVRPGPRLLKPVRSARLSTPPLLLWTPVGGASYYNVQLYRDGRKVLSAWPTVSRLQLAGTWSFDRRRYRLRPGRYRWYVWPGVGRRAAARYASVIGTRTFVVTRRP
jgi:hypothetical protein